MPETAPGAAVAAHLPALRLKRNEDRRLNAGHLWVFSNEVDTQQTPLGRFKAGELVRVLSHNDRALGLAYVNPKSLISARLLETWRMPDAAWFAQRIERALELRERLYAEPYYRLVYGESDALPGLIVDRYGAQCVAQIGTAGMELMKPQITAGLLAAVGCETLIYKNDGASRELEGLDPCIEAAAGRLEAAGRVIEGGLEFKVPLALGQKTGWFFDQADNRAAMMKYVSEGARVLDVFSYVGAWGLRAARAGAGSVTCVDSSAAALELAAENAVRNSLALEVRKGDAFDVLESLAEAHARFELVIVDPPAFAKRKKDLPKALAAYRRLNHLAMRILAPGGILISCSCSYHVAPADLEDAIAKAARGAQKQLQVLETRGQGPDHPVHPAIPETRYLKAYFCRVTDGLK